MSIIDPGSLPRLIDVLNRGEDPTTYVPVDYLGDGVSDAISTDDEDRPEAAASARALAHEFAANPPAAGDNRARVLHILWEAELVEQADLVGRLIAAVAEAGQRARLVERVDEARAGRQLREDVAARRQAAWREPLPGSSWVQFDEWHLEVWLAQSERSLGDAAVLELTRRVSELVEAYARDVEASVRLLLPQGIDVQIRVSQ